MQKAKGIDLSGFLVKPVTNSMLFNTIMEAFDYKVSRKDRKLQIVVYEKEALDKIRGAKILVVGTTWGQVFHFDFLTRGVI